MVQVTLARQAMATRFELVLFGSDAVRLRAAGEDALHEIDRCEQMLSLYRPASAVSRINAGAWAGPVRIEPEVFELLRRARELWEKTDGAFDITIAPLMRCWGFMQGTGRWPDPAALDAARQSVGMQFVAFDAAERTIRFLRAEMMLDLGSLGKGYAIDCAIEALLECGVEHALLHGGTSTAYGIGAPPGMPAWNIAIEAGPDAALVPAGVPPMRSTAASAGSTTGSPLAVIAVRDQALSVSAVWGKSFVREGRRYGHVLDPRLGEPVAGALLAACACATATESDALSTALLVGGPAAFDQLCDRFAGVRALVATQEMDGAAPAILRRALTANGRE